MQQPWLSLLIPVYNCSAYLEDCLETILSQAVDNLEIIFYDDASTDASAQRLREFEQRNIAGLKVIYAEQNQGLSVARNNMLEQALGEYVWFLDSDDYLLPGAVQNLREVIEIEAPDAIFFDYRMVDEIVDITDSNPPNNRYITAFGGKPRCLGYDKNALFQGLFSRRRFQAWARVLKRKVWMQGEAFPPGKFFEDLASVPYTLCKIDSYYYVPEAFVAYRRRSSSIVRTPSLDKISDMLQGPLEVLNYWQAQGIVLSERSRFEYYKFCAINFVNATKMLRAAGIASTQTKRHFRDQLFAAFGFGLKTFIWKYVRHGELLSLYRALRYLLSRH